MKKALSLMFLVGGLLLTSCSKDFNCTCTIVQKDSDGTVINTGTSASVINDTEKKAKESCESGNISITNGGFTSTTTCVLAER